MRNLTVRLRILTVPAIAALAIGLFGCPQTMNNEFIAKISEDVAAAVAPPRTLTIASDGNGVVSPSGAAEIKDGIEFAISATAFSSHVFKRWTQSGGSGSATFADGSSAATMVVVRGGDASIRAEFEARPTVFYTTPTGERIFTNTKIFIYFSKAMDESSVEAAGAITVMKGGTVAVEGTVELVSESVARFTPSENLAPLQYHVVNVSKSVTDTSSVAMEKDFSGNFKTAGSADNDGPSAVSFAINGSTSLVYLASTTFTLTDVSAADDGEVVEALIQENDGQPQSFPFTPEIDYTLQSTSDGPKTLKLYAVDSVGNVSETWAETTVTLDTVAPAGSFAINDGANAAADYVSATAVTLATALADAGTAMSGAEMRSSQDDGAAWSAWEAYAAAKAATLAAGEGTKTVRLQVRDAAGNAADFSDSIVYDATAPVFSAFALNGGDAYSASDNLSGSLTASDAVSGLSQMAFSVDGGSNWSAWTTYATIGSVAGAPEGAATVGARVRDRAGNVAERSDGIFVDTAAPTLGSVVVDAGAAYALDTDAALTLTASDPNGASGSGVAQMRFSEDGSTWSSWTAYAASADLTLSAANGAKTVYAQVRDAAGNVSASVSDGIVLDTEAPTITQFTIDGTGDGSGAFTNRDYVLLHCAASDSAGTPMEMDFSNDGATWTGWREYDTSDSHSLSSGDGLKTVYCRVRDTASAAHQSTATYSITLDTAGPSATVTSPSTGSYAGFVDCAATATDATSGIWKVEFFGNGESLGIDTTSPYEAPTQWSVHDLEEGLAYDTYAVAYDRAGNDTMSADVVVTVDNHTETLVTPNSSVSLSAAISPTLTAGSDFDHLAIAYAYAPSSVSNIYTTNSTDGGANWTQPKLLATGNFPAAARTADGSMHLFYRDNNGYLKYYKSTTDGSTWTSVSAFYASTSAAAYAPAIATYNSIIHVFYLVGTGTTVMHYYSITGGTSWQQAATISTGTSATSIAACAGPNGVLLFFKQSGTPLLFAITELVNGSIIRSASTISYLGDINSISAAADPNDPLRVRVTCGLKDWLATTFTSDDRGSSWSSAEQIGTPATSTFAAVNLADSGGTTREETAINTMFGKLFVAKAVLFPDEWTRWVSYEIADTRDNQARAISAISDGSFQFIAFYDSSAQRLKFAKVKINF